MTRTHPCTSPPDSIPTDEMVARAWHALSDEPLDGTPFDGNDCTCRNYAVHARRIIELFYGHPTAEPEGLGAVVVNPLTGGVWVRSAHPALPWHLPEEAAPQQWSDPTCEDHYTWADLPRPLVMQSTGWKPPNPTTAPPPTPPTASKPTRNPDEPTGKGAVVVDTTGTAWVRVHGGGEPWLQIDETGTGLAENWEGPFYAVGWADLDQPVQVRSHGWNRP